MRKKKALLVRRPLKKSPPKRGKGLLGEILLQNCPDQKGEHPMTDKGTGAQKAGKWAG